jgi:hypothetical protein
MLDLSVAHRVNDYIDVPFFHAQGKRTRIFDANLVKGGAVLPYLHQGRLVWMLKDEAAWLSDSVIAQLDNLIVTVDHQDHAYSHDAAVGMVRDPALAKPYVQGRIAIFRPSAIEAISDGVLQLSPDAMVELEPVNREINGRWVDYAQVRPRLDHIAIVPKGRHGNDLMLRASDSIGCDTFSLLDLADVQALRTINLPQSKNMEELQVQLAQAQQDLGAAVAKVQDAEARIVTLEAELVETRTALEAVPSQDQALALATEAIALFDAGRAFMAADTEFTLIGCLTKQTEMLRRIQVALAPTVTIQDSNLSAFCAGLLAAKVQPTATEATNTAPASSNAPAATHVADGVFSNVVLTPTATATATATQTVTQPATANATGGSSNPFSKLYSRNGLLA